MERIWDTRIPTEPNTIDTEAATRPFEQDVTGETRPSLPALQQHNQLETAQSHNTPSPSHISLDQDRTLGASNSGQTSIPGQLTTESSTNRIKNPQPEDTDILSLDSGWQYHEPWCWLSICSEPGSNWIQKMTGNREFASVAKRFSQDFVQRTAFDDNLSKAADPPKTTEPTASLYIDGKRFVSFEPIIRRSNTSSTAFYQNCWEADLGIIDRTDVEAQVKAYYQKNESKDDPALFALSNIVFAAGYRSLLAKDPTESFSTAQTKAGRYFKNALSVFTRLLFPPSSLTAVRALTLMVGVQFHASRADC